MAMTATELRANVYKVLDEVIATGKPVEVTRKGCTVKISPAKRKRAKKTEDIFERMKRHALPDLIVGDPEDLVHIDWSEYWKPEDN